MPALQGLKEQIMLLQMQGSIRTAGPFDTEIVDAACAVQQLCAQLLSWAGARIYRPNEAVS